MDRNRGRPADPAGGTDRRPVNALRVSASPPLLLVTLFLGLGALLLLHGVILALGMAGFTQIFTRLTRKSTLHHHSADAPERSTCSAGGCSVEESFTEANRSTVTVVGVLSCSFVDSSARDRATGSVAS